MLRQFSPSILSLILFLALNVQGQGTRDDLARMDGHWNISYLEWGYHVVPTQGKLNITEHSFSFGGGTLEIQTLAAPQAGGKYKEINLKTENGKTLKGIYYLTEQELWLCVNAQGQRPESFTTQTRNLGTWFLKLKRID